MNLLEPWFVDMTVRDRRAEADRESTRLGLQEAAAGAAPSPARPSTLVRLLTSVASWRCRRTHGAERPNAQESMLLSDSVIAPARR